jgi:hypothetical protein
MSDVPRHMPISITSAIVRCGALVEMRTSPKVMAHAHGQEEELKAP